MEVGRHERVVYGQCNVFLFTNFCHTSDVAEFQHWICRRLDPYHFSIGADGFSDGAWAGSRIDVSELDAVASVHLVEQSESPTVQIIAGNDVVAGAQRVHDRVGGCQAGSERETIFPTFKRCKIAFQGKTRLVVRSSVFVPFVVTWTVLRIGRCEVDRSHNRTGFRIWLLASVNSLCVEMKSVFIAHACAVPNTNFSGSASNTRLSASSSNRSRMVCPPYCFTIRSS